MKRTVMSAVMASFLFALVLVTLPGDSKDTTEPTWDQIAQAKHEKALSHAAPGSDRAFKAQLKLDRLEAWRKGRPQAGFPDEFAQVLHDMRVPSDRETHEYEPGYRFRQLERTPKSPAIHDKSGTWQMRGPGNVAGRARGIIVDPIDPSGDTWFIAAVGGGVWHTTDAGTNWTELTDDMPTLAIQSLAQAPSNGNVLYAGTGESFYNIDTLHGNGILKSTDRGLTWTPLASTVNDVRFNNVSRIIVDPTDPDIVVCSTTVGRYKLSVDDMSYIFRSTDGGATWSVSHTEVGFRVTQVIATPGNFNVQYAAVDGLGIFKSIDAGVTWTEENDGIFDFSGRFELAIHPVNTNYIYASAEGASTAELWVSVDGADNWLQTTEIGSGDNWLGGQGWYDNTIICHPTDPDIVYVGGPQLYSITLTQVGQEPRDTVALASYWFPHPDHHILEIVHPAGGDWYLLGTNDGGVARTSTGVTGFTQPTDGMVTTQFYGVDKRPGASAYVGGTQDNGTWLSPLDPTETSPWTAVIGGDGYETSWHFDDPQKIIGGYQYNGLNRSLDGGATWSSATSGLSDTGSGSAPFITKIGKSQARPDHLFAVGASGIWRSTDFGGDWDLMNVNALDWGELSSFMDVRVSKADPDIVWAGSRMDDLGKIVVSTDGGLNFSASAVWPDVTMGRISGLATHPTEPNTAYVLFSYAERPKILKTTDTGATWTDISGFGTGSVSTSGFPDVAIYDLVVWPNDTNRIWVGSEIGLLESLDGGATWGLANNGLPAVGIWFLALVEDEIVAGTHGRGIWSVTIPELTTGLTFKPLFESMVQAPSGNMDLEFNLRSDYDSTQVWIDGVLETTFPANTPKQLETLSVPVITAGTKTAFARGFKDGVAYDSITRQVDTIVVATPVQIYENAFPNDIDADDFNRTDMVWNQPSGFSSGALHTYHDYANSSAPMASLLIPIEITTTSQLAFDEIAIIEPGEPGSVYGDNDFWDYAIVEATPDGSTWIPLVDGYDCRADAAWETAYYGSGSGTESMYRNRTIDLASFFDTGDVVLLRFRMFADGSVNGWGWAIDNINVTSGPISGAGDLPVPTRLAQNFPNPFNPKTTIAFNLEKSVSVKLQVFDARGRLVRTLIDEQKAAGPHTVTWDGRDSGGRGAAAGLYLYQLKAGDKVMNRKMTLLK